MEIVGSHNISEKKIGNPLIFSHTYDTRSVNTVRMQTKWKKLDCAASQSFSHSRTKKFLIMFSKIVQKLSHRLLVGELTWEPTQKSFPWTKIQKERVAFIDTKFRVRYQISSNLKIFGCSSANAAIEVVLLFEINSYINRKKIYVKNS